MKTKIPARPINPQKSLEDLPGLGPCSVSMLNAAGFETLDELAAAGAVTAFFRVRKAGCKPRLNLLWAIEGALSGKSWQTVAKEDRTSLLLALEDFERAK